MSLTRGARRALQSPPFYLHPHTWLSSSLLTGRRFLLPPFHLLHAFQHAFLPEYGFGAYGVLTTELCTVLVQFTLLLLS